MDIKMRALDAKWMFIWARVVRPIKERVYG
jgi:hypothetical protein